MKREIEAFIDKSRRSIKAAKLLCEVGDFDFAVARAYYAIFYISEALLLKKGKSFSKHTAVISAIFDSFIKSGELSKEFHQTLHQAFDLRQQGDYWGTTQITEEVAQKVISEVKKQVEVARGKLQGV